MPFGDIFVSESPDLAHWENLCDAPTGRIALYYGAADAYAALAFCHVDEVFDYVKKHHEDVP
jgi:hypothetical protein